MSEKPQDSGYGGAGLDWEFGQSDSASQQTGFTFRPALALLVIGALLALVIGGWQLVQREARRQEDRRIERVQELVDFARQALLANDGDLFFSFHKQDAAWHAALLSPDNQAVFRSQPVITRARERGDEIWANVSWQAGGQRLQRVVFLGEEDGRLQFLPTSATFWGNIRRFSFESDELSVQVRMHEADSEWARDIGAFILQTLVDLCEQRPTVCPDERLPEVITLADDTAPTALPGELRLPSPRLVALDEEGQPAEPFWQMLAHSVETFVQPAEIRFAVPDDMAADYRQLATEFAELQAGVQVQIVSLDELPPDPADWPAEIDGAALTPTAPMLAAGLARDLTPYARTDPDFDRADFYDQIWQGAVWRNRIWFMPQSADMRLLFYDRQAYRKADLAAPSLRWTWGEMNDDLALLVASPESEHFGAVFLDPSRDTLFSYAFNLDNDCPGQATVSCIRPLSSRATSAALEWYLSLKAVDGMTVDLTELSEDERDHAIINLISPRKVIIWAEQPTLFEHHILYQPTGVVPFPGSERSEGITPLWVQGSFISQASRYPLATWEWLKYLSHQGPTPRKRLVPARPSVAVETNYWARLPRPVSEAMRIAFPFARPVLIDEYGHFSWEQLAAISSGEQTPAEAAQAMARLHWFGPDAQ